MHPLFFSETKANTQQFSLFLVLLLPLILVMGRCERASQLHLRQEISVQFQTGKRLLKAIAVGEITVNVFVFLNNPAFALILFYVIELNKEKVLKRRWV